MTTMLRCTPARHRQETFMTSDTTNGTKSQERTDVVIVGRGFGRAIGLLPFVGAR
jgi:hypothetical protein